MFRKFHTAFFQPAAIRAFLPSSRRSRSGLRRLDAALRAHGVSGHLSIASESAVSTTAGNHQITGETDLRPHSYCAFLVVALGGKCAKFRPNLENVLDGSIGANFQQNGRRMNYE